jgi:hypothetical protein
MKSFVLAAVLAATVSTTAFANDDPWLWMIPAESWAQGPAPPPTSAKWWTDFGITAGIVGGTVSSAVMGCAIAAAPSGPIGIVIAGVACGYFGTWAGQRLTIAAANAADRDLDPNAFATGTIAGTIVGGLAGSMGAEHAIGVLNSGTPISAR